MREKHLTAHLWLIHLFIPHLEIQGPCSPYLNPSQSHVWFHPCGLLQHRQIQSLVDGMSLAFVYFCFQASFDTKSYYVKIRFDITEKRSKFECKTDYPHFQTWYELSLVGFSYRQVAGYLVTRLFCLEEMARPTPNELGDICMLAKHTVAGVPRNRIHRD
jgi:hypothetical protein